MPETSTARGHCPRLHSSTGSNEKSRLVRPSGSKINREMTYSRAAQGAALLARNINRESRSLPTLLYSSKRSNEKSRLVKTKRLKINRAMTYSRGCIHYHRPRGLNCRVRKGNGCFQPGMGTGRRLDRGALRVATHPIDKEGWWNESSRIEGCRAACRVKMRSSRSTG